MRQIIKYWTCWGCCSSISVMVCECRKAVDLFSGYLARYPLPYFIVMALEACRCCTRPFLVNILSSIVVEMPCCCGLGVNLVALTISMDMPEIGVWVRKRVADECSFLLQPHDYTDSKKPAPSPSSHHRVCVCLILGLIYSPYTNHPLCFEF